MSNTIIQQLTTDYDAAESAYINLLYSYNQLMDGGNTNALLTQIELSWSADVQTLFNELMSRAPYLSQDILRDVAIRDILPHAMMLTVCISNPDATKDEGFLYFLQYEIPSPLPQYMIEVIKTSWDDDTPRTTMENLQGDYNSQMSFIADKLLADLYTKSALDIDSLYIGDTTHCTQQIRYWLNRVQTLSAKYDLIEDYLATNELVEAEEVLNAIPNDFNLSDAQQMAYDDYVYFYNFRKTLFENKLDLSALAPDQVDELVNFVQGDITFAKGLAQNALCFYYEICREDDYAVEGQGNRMMHQGHAPNALNPNEKVNSLDAKVSVSPNPAMNVATFIYSLLSAKQPVLSICDLSGKAIMSMTLPDRQGKYNRDTSSVNSGLYYYTVKDGDVKIAEGSISVKK